MEYKFKLTIICEECEEEILTLSGKSQESLEEELGKSKIKAAITEHENEHKEADEEDEELDHDCRAEGGESGCDHPSHKGQEEKALALEE